MTKKPRHWSADQKLQILKEAEVDGVTKTLRRHNIYYTTFYKWKERYAREGIDGLSGRNKQMDPEKRELWRENQRLRQIIADQALALKVKEELLKKTVPPSKPGNP